MIEGITGLPGEGKSYLGTDLLLAKLVWGHSFVVTTLPLVLPDVRRYVVEKRGPDAEPWDLDANLKVITKMEAFEFYRYRSGGLVLEESPDRHTEGERNMSAKRVSKEALVAFMDSQFERMIAKPEYMRPVDYFIDEAHNVFSSREWATNGRSTLYYASQHRHLHDQVYLITQSFENVEKQLRTLVGETHSCRNHINRSIGPFRMRPVFVVRSYYGHETRNVMPYRITKTYLDIKGVGACYESTGALGVHKIPEPRRNKGVLPWWSAIAMGAFAVLLLVAFVAFGPKLIFRHIFNFTPLGKTIQAEKEARDKLPQVAAESVAVLKEVAAVEEAAPKLLLLNGVSSYSDESAMVHVVETDEWITAVKAGRNVWRLEDGTFGRLETNAESKARAKREAKETETKPENDFIAKKKV